MSGTIDHLGKYELRQILGKGAMGVVYEGFDPVIARRVAIKTVRLPDAGDADAQEELARFRREAQAAGRLSHPNIVGVFDYGESDTLAYIVMEFVDGQTLKSMLDRQERLALPDIIRVMEELLRGLGYSHDHGVIHRDIKPANIIITDDGRVKIADFGVARIEASSMTQAGTMIGTPAYMSPEQFTGQPVDARTDLNAGGVLLYQLLTGDKPFEGSISSIMHKVLNIEPPAPSALSIMVTPELDAVVRRAMAKRPQDRFTSAQAFASALAEAGHAPADADATMIAPSTKITEPRIQPPRRRFVSILGLTLAVLIGGGVAGYVALGGKPRPGKINLTSQLTSLLTPLPCALLHVNSHATIGGMIGTGRPNAALDAAIKSLPVTNAAQPVSSAYCNVLDTVAPYDGLFSHTGFSLSLTGGTTLKDGALIKISLTTPRFPAYVTVDYFSHDGSVLHVHPSAQLLPPHSAFMAQNGGAIGTVGPPYGEDLIVAIASSKPLFAASRPEAETASAYLPAVGQALLAEQAAGGTLAITALKLDTAAK